ncbi:pyruvate dehydrogenase (acetyl-transferring), homodimeric type [Salinisphaera sp. Q1T1-3]|uniref:pyruvate dehydrogenase (acetyl-transferring), homodimeric type n=1 Tax=Salinisphaera sp. Q1T1-3 TaxID=2321229 RepID=UPI000E7445AD|nr:pyruvate dehydrogenase (acetyl-transferring), homodimeric type [Salinisphaera sp. Q1T1-3]RJS91513.1 pyruvate dehydrogenase (acetyl-transferring), homodimeric type [Salinisphaera sp. Q1T1-3]
MSDSTASRTSLPGDAEAASGETADWVAALDSLIACDGPERAHHVLTMLGQQARRAGIDTVPTARTPYVNTIPVDRQPPYPGDLHIEWRIRSLIRWNAMAMVLQANRRHAGVGGHIASFASAATLYEVGFNHFFRAPCETHDGDLVYFQGHSAPGFYARSYLEGRFDEDRLRDFRAESKGSGLSSYPHTWLMPDYWQFSTVSMGIGPINAIHQARFMRYLHNRGIRDTRDRHVWCFCGDGEMDEPESRGALGLAAREGLDHLIFVINCNLQRLDGPVRGSGRIVDELEGSFRGAGWNVIKVLWGSSWDALLAADRHGRLEKRMAETHDGDYQAFKANGGAYTRQHFFGGDPALEALVATLSDTDIARLDRGGHDPVKVHAAYAQAVNNRNGRPTVILAKTVKGYGMGDSGEGRNITHQQKKVQQDDIRAFRDRFEIPVDDAELDDMPFHRPAADAETMQYLHARRRALGGYLPARRRHHETLDIPPLSMFSRILEGSGGREMATTSAFVRMLQILARTPQLKDRLVPIIPDEARTFGMEGMFRSMGIYAPFESRFTPEDAGQLAYYRQAVDGQILEEGITEAGAMSSFIAAGTSYDNHATTMIPFYAFYAMFGYQRIGDLCWAAADMCTRGFLMAGTSGRTTMNGEGLQHQDGHSHVLFDLVPNCRAYDPTFGYEMAVIIHRGLQDMYVEQHNVHYYITMTNENYAQPAMPEGVEDDIIKGLYPFREDRTGHAHRVQLLGCGTILREVIAAADLLDRDWHIGATVWSAPSFSQLKRDGLSAQRWNMLHPEAPPRQSFVASRMVDADGPAIAATDYMKAYPEMIRAFMPRPYYTLGTDGYGRSDTRAALRDFFEVDRRWIAVTALRALADLGTIDRSLVAEAIRRYDIDPEKPAPVTH